MMQSNGTSLNTVAAAGGSLGSTGVLHHMAGDSDPTCALCMECPSRLYPCRIPHAASDRLQGVSISQWVVTKWMNEWMDNNRRFQCFCSPGNSKKTKIKIQNFFFWRYQFHLIFVGWLTSDSSCRWTMTALRTLERWRSENPVCTFTKSQHDRMTRPNIPTYNWHFISFIYCLETVDLAPFFMVFSGSVQLLLSWLPKVSFDCEFFQFCCTKAIFRLINNQFWSHLLGFSVFI